MTTEESTRIARDPEKKLPVNKSKDQDKGKGATEKDQNHQGANTGMQNQLGHRDEDSELKDEDSGLPG